MISEIHALGMSQVIALVTGVIYVILAARERAACWIFGIVSCALIAWDDFTSFQLYADGVLQLIYVGLGLAGLYHWLARDAGNSTSPIIRWQPGRHLMLLASAVILSVPFGWLLANFTDAAFGYVDTLTTLLSIAATWMLVRKVLENWLYWIAIDLVYVYLYAQRGGLLIAVLFFVYLVVAIFAFVGWQRRYRASHN